LNSPDYIKGIKEKLKGPFTEDKAKFVANIALKNGYSRKDTQDFIDNLRESGRVKPLPMPSSRLGKGLSLMTNSKNKIPDNLLNKKGKLDTNIQDQINGFATNVGSKMFERTGLRGLNKNSSEVFVLSDVQNSRMDILDSNKKPIGEIKAGRITRDNLVSKAIESQALQLGKQDERSSFPFYKNNNEEPISFEKPFTLVKRYKNSTAALPFSNKGFIPNFASRYTEARKQKRDELRASLFNIGDFAGGAIQNINAQTEFNKARYKNPNVEFDDKINQVGFKVERIPILDREFEAALRSKENNK
jgi:hypothetical protein